MPAITSENLAQAIVALVAAKSMQPLMAKARLATLVNRNYSSDIGQVGDKVTIKIPPVMTANNIAETGTVQTQNPSPGFATVQLNSHVEATLEIPDVTKVVSGQDPLEDYLEPAMIAVAKRIEADLNSLYPQLLGSAGSSSAAISEAAIDAAESAMFLAQVPEETPKYLQCHADTWSTVRNIQRFSEADKIGTGEAIVSGEVGKVKGLYAFRSFYAVKDGSNVYHNIAFTKDTFALVTRQLPTIMPGTGAVAQFVNYQGFGLRVVMSYNAATLSQKITVDTLYGVAVLRPTFGVDLQSNA